MIAGAGPASTNPLEGGPWWAYLIGAALTAASVIVPVFLSRNARTGGGGDAPPPAALPPGTTGDQVASSMAGATDAEIALIRDLVKGLQEDKTRLMTELDTLRQELDRRQHTIDRLNQMVDAIISRRQTPPDGITPPPTIGPPPPLPPGGAL